MEERSECQSGGRGAESDDESESIGMAVFEGRWGAEGAGVEGGDGGLVEDERRIDMLFPMRVCKKLVRNLLSAAMQGRA